MALSPHTKRVLGYGTSTGLEKGFERAGVFSGFQKSKPSGVLGIEELLALAEQEGGAAAELARELTHPKTSILSTIGDTAKDAFHLTLDALMTPSEAVAGVISEKYSVSEAISKDIMPSDVIFGEQEKDLSGLEKVGQFSARLATDILLDPLTYATFGAGLGIFGLRGAPKVTLSSKAAERAGIKAGFAKNLSKEGKDLFKHMKSFERQLAGKEATQAIKSGKKIYGLAEKELKTLLKGTVDSGLDIDWTKRAISNLLENNPNLVSTLIDKGGIKFFGKTLLSGQKIRYVKNMIPGMSMVDNVVSKVSRPIQALFDPSLIKVSGRYKKLPEEFVGLIRGAKESSIALRDERVAQLVNVVRENGLNRHEANLLTASVEAGVIPADKKLANAFKKLTGFNEQEIKALRERGLSISRKERHVPHMFIENDPKFIPFTTPPSKTLHAAKIRKLDDTIFDVTAVPEKIHFFNKRQGDNLTNQVRKLIDGGKEVDEVIEEVINVGKKNDISFSKKEARQFHKSVKQMKELEEEVLKDVDKKRLDKMFEELTREGFEGFDKNMVTALAARTMENVRATTMNDFMRAVARSPFARPKSQAPSTWVKVSSSGIKEATEELSERMGGILDSIVSKEGEEFLFHPAVAKKIESFVAAGIGDDATRDFWKNFDKLQNLWKASVTTPFPAFHGRNGISNVFLHMMDLGVESLNPKTHGIASGLILKDVKANKLARKAAGSGKAAREASDQLSELLERTVFKDATGYDWSFGELRSIIKQRGVAFRRDILGQIDIRARDEQLLKTIMRDEGLAKKAARKGLPFSQEFALFKGGKRVGRAVEEQARLVDFVANLRKTGDVQLAAQRTKQFLFDYTFLTPFEKNIMRRLIPFYTFTRKNLELQVRALAKTPGRVAAEIKTLKTAGDVFFGGELTDEEREALPEWISDGIATIAERRGSTLEVFGSLGTPFEQIFEAMQPKALLGSVSPLLRVPLEEATGYHFFLGKPLQDVNNAAAFKKFPKSVKDFIGYTEVEGTTKDGEKFNWSVSLRPKRMHLLLNAPPWSRFLSTMKQVQTEDVSGQYKLLQQLIGVRPFSFDIEQESARREKELRRDLENILNDAGVTAKFTRTFIPKEDKGLSF